MSLKANLNEELSSFYKELTGRGPKYLKTYFYEDMIIVRFDWYKDPIFKELFNTEKGENIAVNIYRELFKNNKEYLKRIVENVIGIKVKKVYFDPFIVSSDEDKLFVFLLNERLKK